MQHVDLCWSCQDSRTYCLYQMRRGRRKETGRSIKPRWKMNSAPEQHKILSHCRKQNKDEEQTWKDAQKQKYRLQRSRAEGNHGEALTREVLPSSYRHLQRRNDKWTKHLRERMGPLLTVYCNLGVNNSSRQKSIFQRPHNWRSLGCSSKPMAWLLNNFINHETSKIQPYW